MTAVKEKSELAVIWSSADREVAGNTTFNYVLSAKSHDWWSDVYLIIWGPSARLLSEDSELQMKVNEIMEKGVKVSACIYNAYSYGVCDSLAHMGIDLKGMSEPISDMMKRGAKIIVF